VPRKFTTIDQLGQRCLDQLTLTVDEASWLSTLVGQLAILYHIEIEDTEIFPMAAKSCRPRTLNPSGRKWPLVVEWPIYRGRRMSSAGCRTRAQLQVSRPVLIGPATNYRDTRVMWGSYRQQITGVSPSTDIRFASSCISANRQQPRKALEPQQHQISPAIKALSEDVGQPWGGCPTICSCANTVAVGLIDRLEERTLVRRTRAKDGDRRRVLVHMTRRGETSNACWRMRMHKAETLGILRPPRE